MKIRLARKWYLPFERMRGVEEVDGFFTVRGLAKRLELNRSTVYRFIYKEIIPPEYIERHSLAGVYLIRNDPQLIDRLRKRVMEQKGKNRLLKPAESS